VFVHRGRKILACTGFPNYIFIADGDSLELLEKVEIKESSGEKSVVGSLFPSPDGEKICLITTRSFQMVDVESGRADFVHDLGKIYDPFNHMTCVSDTDW